MNFELYDHNKAAYTSAVEMMEAVGKAAIIHPTGTGKSFIGFRLAADHPNERILWLSPSRYIFETQLENLKAASSDKVTTRKVSWNQMLDEAADHVEGNEGHIDISWSGENIKFLTYAKLMLMGPDEISELHPAYIILDEFHCCGAEMWGQGVQRLLDAYPNVPILGLTATNIRYLDNQRDMAQELFDGHIASEITLGEAIVRGILAPPKYVLSIFKYQDDLAKYEARIRGARSKAVRDEGEKYLEALRRALENADGLDVIFDRHMTNRTGKYIVFCANKEHMDEMMCHMEWFAKVDKHPHVYSLYAADPSTSKEFAAFKADDDDTHLRLLYCIDALNQGIHVPDISGVILLRPTVSPIIYKQQIGRALSAIKTSVQTESKACPTVDDAYIEPTGRAVNEAVQPLTHESAAMGRVAEQNAECPVIFDIVMNIENLYSIGAIEEEMEIATAYYRSLGESEYVVNERFQVVDEVRNCVELFDKLNGVLTASWDLMYEKARGYFEENGDLNVPHRYITADGYSLGSWVSAQRAIRAGTMHGSLSEEQIEKLSAIGMVWQSRADLAWAKNYAAAKAYYDKNGVLDVPGDYVTDDGVALGAWLKNIRKWRNAGAHQNYLTPERIDELDSIGMVWDRLDYYWEQMYQAASEYYLENRTLDVPDKYITKDGLRLGAWIHRMRSARRQMRQKLGYGNTAITDLTEDRIKRLDAIGMIWTDGNEASWNRNYELAKQYFRQNGSISMPKKYEVSGVKLGYWVDRQKSAYRAGKLSESRKKRLESIGISRMTGARESWKSRAELAKRYLKEHNASSIPKDAVIDGVWIGKWLAVQRKALEAGKLSQEQQKQLKEIPLRSRNEELWENAYNLAKEYYEENGTLDVPRKYVCGNGYGLGNWISYQRKQWKEGCLAEEKVRRLEEIGFVWEVKIK